MKSITPLEDNVIVKLIEPEKKIGSIIIPGSAVEKSTLAEVMIPNSVSYWRDGTPRTPFLKTGMKVRIPKGNVGTGVPEAPEEEEWLSVSEDSIYYIIED